MGHLQRKAAGLYILFVIDVFKRIWLERIFTYVNACKHFGQPYAPRAKGKSRLPLQSWERLDRHRMDRRRYTVFGVPPPQEGSAHGLRCRRGVVVLESVVCLADVIADCHVKLDEEIILTGR